LTGAVQDKEKLFIILLQMVWCFSAQI